MSGIEISPNQHPAKKMTCCVAVSSDPVHHGDAVFLGVVGSVAEAATEPEQPEAGETEHSLIF